MLIRENLEVINIRPTQSREGNGFRTRVDDLGIVEGAIVTVVILIQGVRGFLLTMRKVCRGYDGIYVGNEASKEIFLSASGGRNLNVTVDVNRFWRDTKAEGRGVSPKVLPDNGFDSIKRENVFVRRDTATMATVSITIIVKEKVCGRVSRGTTMA